FLGGSSVRDQVRLAPSQPGSVTGYPKPLHNNDGLDLAANQAFSEYPSTSTDGRTGRGFRGGGNPSAVRAFYNNPD
ncbi:hypothetical protein N658DRAFT_434199, partial [Parathielavia hyrcaniae]